MSKDLNNDQAPNQGCLNVVNFTNNDNGNNSNHSNSSNASKGSGKSGTSSRPGSQGERDIKIHCGDINTTHNYNKTSTTKENSTIPIPTFILPLNIFVSNNKNSGKLKKTTN